jgi:hypothetical protein
MAKQLTVALVDAEIATLENQITALENQQADLERQIAANFAGDTSVAEGKLTAILAKLRGSGVAKKALLDRRNEAQRGDALIEIGKIAKEARRSEQRRLALLPKLEQAQNAVNLLADEYRQVATQAAVDTERLQRIEDQARRAGVSNDAINEANRPFYD